MDKFLSKETYDQNMMEWTYELKPTFISILISWHFVYFENPYIFIRNKYFILIN